MGPSRRYSCVPQIPIPADLSKAFLPADNAIPTPERLKHFFIHKIIWKNPNYKRVIANPVKSSNSCNVPNGQQRLTLAFFDAKETLLTVTHCLNSRFFPQKLGS